jgi:hypothetical protein
MPKPRLLFTLSSSAVRLEPRPQLQFPLAVLAGGGGCESDSQPGLHAAIRAKFAGIMDKYFSRVPTCPDFYLFCPARPPPTVTGAGGAGARRHGDTGFIGTPSGKRHTKSIRFCTTAY